MQIGKKQQSSSGSGIRTHVFWLMRPGRNLSCPSRNVFQKKKWMQGWLDLFRLQWINCPLLPVMHLNYSCRSVDHQSTMIVSQACKRCIQFFYMIEGENDEPFCANCKLERFVPYHLAKRLNKMVIFVGFEPTKSK